MMKKHFKKMFAVMIAAGMLFSSAQTVSAGSDTINGAGTTKLQTNSTLYDGQDDVTALPVAPTQLDVQAMVTGGPEIVYSIDISWGNMQFEYSYGKTWNPSTHTYSNTGNPTVGWTAASVDGVNNKITITNNSNFPVTADFSYTANGTALNAHPSDPGSVVGIFSYSSPFSAAALSGGKGSSVLTASYFNPSQMVLEMDTTALSAGDVYYYKTTNPPLAADTTDDIYFALSGRPDVNGPSSYTSVGTINITIAPATGTTRRTK